MTRASSRLLATVQAVCMTVWMTLFTLPILFSDALPLSRKKLIQLALSLLAVYGTLIYIYTYAPAS